MKILVTGALGQIGTELTVKLAERYGENSILISDIRERIVNESLSRYRYCQLDVLNGQQLNRIVKSEGITVIYHLAAILSANAEKIPLTAWNINVQGLVNILETARINGCSVFTPSSIGAFGPDTPKDATPQITIQRPVSIYGISKVSGELLCDYYHLKYGVDTRGVRFPGIISAEAPPGGGTTDYAVEIYYEALRKNSYTCFLAPNTRLDMMYMPDALKAVIMLMEADGSKLRYRNAYNITSMNFTPSEQAEIIKKFLPDFTIDFSIDPEKQRIADSWPNSLDDSPAREDWGWAPEYNIETMSEDMLKRISMKEKIDVFRNEGKNWRNYKLFKTSGNVQSRKSNYHPAGSTN